MNWNWEILQWNICVVSFWVWYVMFLTLWMKNQRFNDFLVSYLVLIKIKLSLITQKQWKKRWGKLNSILSSIKIEMRILRIGMGMGKRLRGLTLRRKGKILLIEIMIRYLKEVISLELVNLLIILKIRMPNHQPSSIKKFPKKKQ